MIPPGRVLWVDFYPGLRIVNLHCWDGYRVADMG